MSITYNSQDMETTLVSTDGWMSKENGIYMCVYKHTHTRLLFSHKKERSPTTCDNMDRLWGHYAK